MIPPVIFYVRVRDKGRTVFVLPIPFILLWPLVVVLPLVSLPFLAILQAALYLTRWRYPLCQAVLIYLQILGSLRGLQVYVNDKKDNSLVRVTVI